MTRPSDLPGRIWLLLGVSLMILSGSVAALAGDPPIADMGLLAGCFCSIIGFIRLLNWRNGSRERARRSSH